MTTKRKGHTPFLAQKILRAQSLTRPQSSFVNLLLILGSLINEDGGDNQNGKKAIGLDDQNNNFPSPFFIHFFAVTKRLRRENA